MYKPLIYFYFQQAVLGEEAKEGERNLIELETTTWVHKELKQPIFSLTLGCNDNVSIETTNWVHKEI